MLVESSVLTNAVVASCVVFVPATAVGAVGVPVRAGEASGALRLTDVTRAAAAESLAAKAVAISPSVSSVPGAALIKLFILFFTYSVVATCVVLVESAAVVVNIAPVESTLANTVPALSNHLVKSPVCAINPFTVNGIWFAAHGLTAR